MTKNLSSDLKEMLISQGATLVGFGDMSELVKDNESDMRYGNQYATIWDGLGILNYAIVPHYRSEHFESEAMETSVQYLIDNKMLFIALKDGEVIVVE